MDLSLSLSLSLGRSFSVSLSLSLSLSVCAHAKKKKSAEALPDNPSAHHHKSLDERVLNAALANDVGNLLNRCLKTFVRIRCRAKMQDLETFQEMKI